MKVTDMKNFAVALSVVFAAIAAFAGQAQAFSPEPAPVCRGFAAQSDECIVHERCGDLKAKLTNLLLEQWHLENKIARAELGNQTRESARTLRALNREMARVDRRIGRANGRLDRCADRALR